MIGAMMDVVTWMVLWVAGMLLVTGVLVVRRPGDAERIRRGWFARKGSPSKWTPPASLTDEDRTWLDYHSRMDLAGWVAYQERRGVDADRGVTASLPGAAAAREHKVEKIDPDEAVARIERIVDRGGSISSHDVIAATRGERLKIVSHNLDGSCVLELQRRSGTTVYVQATRELMMQVTGASLPGRRGSCKFHGWVADSSGATRCIDCGADYDNPREWNGGW